MYYFVYTTIRTADGIPYKLDPLGYGNKITEFLVDSDTDKGVKQYVVSVDLEERDLVLLVKAQKVTLETITEEEYKLWRNASTPYQSEWEALKVSREQELANATVTYLNTVYDADEDSISRMGDIITDYNYRFINLLCSKEVNTTNAREAQKVYDERIEWKGNNGEYNSIEIKSLREIYTLAIANRERIWKKYEIK